MRMNIDSLLLRTRPYKKYDDKIRIIMPRSRICVRPDNNVKMKMYR